MTGADGPHGALTTTSAAVERGAAVLLGADDGTAVGAVAALEAAQRLHQGVAVHALVLAARKGTDAAAALAMLAAGIEPAGQWSDFELRIAAEEAADDLAGLRQAVTDGSATVAGPDLPMRAARALRTGMRALVIPDPGEDAAPADRLAARWVEGLAAAAGRSVRRTADPVPTDRPADASRAPTVARGGDYLDVVALL